MNSSYECSQAEMLHMGVTGSSLLAFKGNAWQGIYMVSASLSLRERKKTNFILVSSFSPASKKNKIWRFAISSIMKIIFYTVLSWSFAPHYLQSRIWDLYITQRYTKLFFPQKTKKQPAHKGECRLAQKIPLPSPQATLPSGFRFYCLKR